MDNPFSDLIRIKNSLPKKPINDKTKKELVKETVELSQNPEHTNQVTEAQEFLMAMDGVTPLKTPAKRLIPTPPDPNDFNSKPVNEDLEVIQHLNDLVAGFLDFDISFSDEFIEGHVKGLPDKLTRSLKEGALPIEDRLDLHGHSLEAARQALSKFISVSSFFGKKTVLIIHGRGLRSPDKNPVLKSNLENLLLKSHIKKYILAFCSARPCDGGTGASYVLLRNPSKKKGRKKDA
ncbi:MAG: Smr/MutS family protein [Deltaproteobacteria bacterium]|jgi:DNA-nicking Smr family endonuclease|nr:Smr/MutS family protein [Deltaproteobacteria bacterium]